MYIGTYVIHQPNIAEIERTHVGGGRAELTLVSAVEWFLR